MDEEKKEELTEEPKEQDDVKKSKPGARLVMLRIMMAISILAVVVCGVGLGRELYINWQSQSYYSDLSSGIETRPRTPPPSRQRPEPVTLPDGTVDPDAEDLWIDDDIEPDDDEPWGPYVDFETLNELFPNSVAWIQLDGTAIDYPVMRGRDNDYYLTRLPDGTQHRSGSIFMDYRNKQDFSDKHTLIYGHESRTKDMFGSLKDYRSQAYYEENPSLFLFTPDADYELVLISAYTLDSGVEVPPLTFRNDTEFERHITNIKRRSFFKNDVTVEPDDQIVSLCTCAYDYTNARLIVVGKLVKFGGYE